MPLIQIEVCDFKSYRGHQVIGPFQHFTSVIGPNGAGKSNLMDAISFVLGVKSAQLRSSQLKDLVYRGRRLAREPADVGEEGSHANGTAMDDEEEDEDGEGDGEGSAKKAWVLALYEDAATKKEWRFQRTISTTGSSEYKLNNKIVTYQAYNTALESHNILVKAKNFLVFQGDVEAVASQSPKDLARLIDQISGSLELAGEYEKAKERVDRATENATFSFSRRRGLAGEIKQYKEQKTEAERFEAMLEEKDATILQLMVWRLFHLEEKMETNAHFVRTRNKGLVELRAVQAEEDEKLAQARSAQAKAKTEVTSKEKTIKKAEKALENKKPDLVALEAQIAHSSRKLNNAKEGEKSTEKEVGKQELAVENLRKQLVTIKKAADAAQEETRRKSEHHISLSQESLVEYRQLKSMANLEAVDARQALETLTREEKTVNRTLTSLRDKQEEFEQKRERLEGEKESNSEKEAELETQVNTLKKDLEAAKKELNNQQAERTRIAELEKDLQEKLEDVHNKLLQAGVDRHESEREVKLKETLSNLQRIFPGVRGRVVDLCKPTQRKYETAVSVVLGRNIDAVVVDSEQTAISCIEYMRNQRAGQATFIPLDTIQAKTINDKYRSFAKGARLAVDVIEFEPAVERAMYHACSNSLVCDTMEIARHVCYDRGQEVKAVTLDGTIIHKSGLITGGRSTHGNGKKWDEKEVDNMRRAQENLVSQIRELVKSKPRGKADDALIGEITRLEGTLRVVRDDLSACKSKLSGVKEELKHITKELKKNSAELADAKTQHSAVLDKVLQHSDVVNSAEDHIFASFCGSIGVNNIREYEERQLKVAQEEGETRLRYDTQLARLKHQIEYQEEALTTTKEKLANLADIIKKETANSKKLEDSRVALEVSVTEAESEIEKFQRDLKRIQDVMDEKSKSLSQAKSSANVASKAVDQAMKDVNSKNDDIEKFASERTSIYRKCRLEEIHLPLLEGSLKNVPMEENLRDEMAMDVDEDENTIQGPKKVPDYGIEVDFGGLNDDEREDGTPEFGAGFDTTVAKINAEIERMAPNMKAIDRLDDVEAKLADTEKEAEKARKDTKSARDEFNDLKRRRCELFNKAYNHISERIDQVYKDLTKGKASPLGGVAYLSLEDSEEPYLSGIKYHAMPPMKRFRDMEQLSGGEKTVAALALLFAIHSYQPSPFFVLDEVDAALDNTNVARIANYIRSHASSAFQFIVISLKGSLYERGNSLVGIYRDQDVNSSRTLTLDLTQYDT